jgi:hypothetical protein
MVFCSIPTSAKTPSKFPCLSVLTYSFVFQSLVTYIPSSSNFKALLAVALFIVSVRKKKELGEYTKAADLPIAGKHIKTVYPLITLNFQHEDGPSNGSRNFGTISTFYVDKPQG